jgi:hypothetical protein
MAEIKVEHQQWLERFDRRLWLPALAIVLGLVLILAVHAINQRQVTNANLPAAPMAAEGKVWVPMGAVALLPDRQMVKVGRTTDGRDLFDVKPQAGGGGGPALVGPTHGVARAWVRMGDDRYQQVALLPILH